VEVARAAPARELRTFPLLDLAQARAARRAAVEGIAAHRPGAVLDSTTTSALLWPAPGAIHFDAPATGNRPGRHGVWQRPVERRRFAAAPLLVAQSEGGLAESPEPHAEALVIPVPAEPSGPPEDHRDVAAVTYAADVEKKGLARVLEAWAAARREGEELVVAGIEEGRARQAAAPGGGVSFEGVRFAGLLSRSDFRDLLRRARVYVTAPRREDYGLAQLEALADGAMLVTTPAPGPYAALPIARDLDPRLVADDLAAALRTALDDPSPSYAERAAEALAPYRRAAVDRTVADELLPRLVG
jgi:glycosyltransferase involved in cell wall biosynthesis